MQSVLSEKVSMKVGFGKCREIMSPSNFKIVARTHARLPYLFLRRIFLQLVVLEKKHVEFGFEKMVSLTCFEIVAQTHVIVSLFFRIEELERMSMNLEIVVDMVSLTCFEIIARTHARVLYSCQRLMVAHFEKVGLSTNLENIMELKSPTFF